MSGRHFYSSGSVYFTVSTVDTLRVLARCGNTEVEMSFQDYQGHPWTGSYDGYPDLGAWLCAGLLSAYPDFAGRALWNDSEDQFTIRCGGPLTARLSL